MFWIKWVLGGALFSVSLWITLLNGLVFWNGLIRKKETSSWIPLLGGLSGTFALFVIPNLGLCYLWWVPLLLDWGCMPGFTYQLLLSLRKQS